MSDHDESERATKNARVDQADKPDEALMSEIAKRLLTTPPEKRKSSNASRSAPHAKGGPVYKYVIARVGTLKLYCWSRRRHLACAPNFNPP